MLGLHHIDMHELLGSSNNANISEYRETIRRALGEFIEVTGIFQQTRLYGSHMGYPYGTLMKSATGFRMGPIWVIPYAGCPDGPHITAP